MPPGLMKRGMERQERSKYISIPHVIFILFWFICAFSHLALVCLLAFFVFSFVGEEGGQGSRDVGEGYEGTRR